MAAPGCPVHQRPLRCEHVATIPVTPVGHPDRRRWSHQYSNADTTPVLHYHSSVTSPCAIHNRASETRLRSRLPHEWTTFFVPACRAPRARSECLLGERFACPDEPLADNPDAA